LLAFQYHSNFPITQVLIPFSLFCFANKTTAQMNNNASEQQQKKIPKQTTEQNGLSSSSLHIKIY
jgi:hypothetical protein